MWGGVGVDPNDRLTRDDASQVLRRAARLARPYWRTAFTAVGFVAVGDIDHHCRPFARSVWYRYRYSNG